MFKICPVCKMQNEVTATVCPGCSHAFRTQFAAPVNQTQVFSGPLQPMPSQHVATGPFSVPSKPTGPRDEFEWKVAAAAMWFLVFSLSVIVYYCLRWSGFTPFWLFMTFGAVAGLLFSIVRLRRLYVYNPFGLRAPVPTFLVLTALALTLFGWEYRDYRLHLEAIAQVAQAVKDIKPGMNTLDVMNIAGQPDSVEHPSYDVEDWHYGSTVVRIYGINVVSVRDLNVRQPQVP